LVREYLLCEGTVAEEWALEQRLRGQQRQE